MLLEKSGEVTPERIKIWSQNERKKSPVVDVTGDGKQKSDAVRNNIA